MASGQSRISRYPAGTAQACPDLNDVPGNCCYIVSVYLGKPPWPNWNQATRSPWSVSSIPSTERRQQITARQQRTRCAWASWSTTHPQQLEPSEVVDSGAVLGTAIPVTFLLRLATQLPHITLGLRCPTVVTSTVARRVWIWSRPSTIPDVSRETLCCRSKRISLCCLLLWFTAMPP